MVANVYTGVSTSHLYVHDHYTCTVDSRYLEIEGTLKTLRDIRTSTYQICSIEEKNYLNNQILQLTM